MDPVVVMGLDCRTANMTGVPRADVGHSVQVPPLLHCVLPG